jgi:hemoglobin
MVAVNVWMLGAGVVRHVARPRKIEAEPSREFSTPSGSRACARQVIAAQTPAQPEQRVPVWLRIAHPRTSAAGSHERAKMVAVKQTIYEAVGGMDALVRLAHAWHARCLADPIVSHAFSHGYHPQHTERLASYWAEALGGPPSYTSTMGDESGVVRMHSGNGEHVEMDERAQACFALALADAGLSSDPTLRDTLQAYFRWATATMSRFPGSREDVPAGLALARWSWDGPALG